MAVLILLGALIIGGNVLDKQAARAGSESTTSATLADGEAKDRPACDSQGPRQRDLTVPYSTRTTPASMGAETCDE